MVSAAWLTLSSRALLPAATWAAPAESFLEASAAVSAPSASCLVLEGSSLVLDLSSPSPALSSLVPSASVPAPSASWSAPLASFFWPDTSDEVPSCRVLAPLPRSPAPVSSLVAPSLREPTPSARVPTPSESFTVPVCEVPGAVGGLDHVGVDVGEAGEQGVGGLRADLLGHGVVDLAGELVGEGADHVVVRVVGGDLQDGLLGLLEVAGGGEVRREVLGDGHGEGVVAAGDPGLGLGLGVHHGPAEGAVIEQFLGDVVADLQLLAVLLGRPASRFTMAALTLCRCA